MLASVLLLAGAFVLVCDRLSKSAAPVRVAFYGVNVRQRWPASLWPNFWMTNLTSKTLSVMVWQVEVQDGIGWSAQSCRLLSSHFAAWRRLPNTGNYTFAISTTHKHMEDNSHGDGKVFGRMSFSRSSCSIHDGFYKRKKAVLCRFLRSAKG